MLFKKDILREIAAKRVTVAFRRWKKPGAKVGETIPTPVGDILLGKVEKVAISKISDADLKRAGYPSRNALQRELAKHPGGDVYRISLRLQAKEVPVPKAPAPSPASRKRLA